MSLNIIEATNYFLPKGRLQNLLKLLIAVVVGITLAATLVISQISKKEVQSSQLLIEKDRITLIDKQLGYLYQKVYNTSDSALTQKTLKQITFLKLQRSEATENIDKINTEPKGEVLVFSIVIVTLVATLITFFSASFRGSLYFDSKSMEIRASKNKTNQSPRNYDFLNWIINNELLKEDVEPLNLERAKILKKIYDFSVGHEGQADMLSKVIEYGRLVTIQSKDTSSVHDEIFFSFNDIQDRLKAECERLNKQALINLFICFIVAFIFICFIGYNTFINNEPTNNLNWERFLIKYLPRIFSLFGLITMFVYFIKLYNNNIKDVKYYQNELTNAEMKMAAIHISISHNDTASAIEIGKNFASTERNVVNHKTDDEVVNPNILKTYVDSTKDIVDRIKILSDSIKDIYKK